MLTLIGSGELTGCVEVDIEREGFMKHSDDTMYI